MPGLKTNERPGTRAVLRHYRMSAYKARQVLDLIRDKDVETADEILRSTPREAARVVAKVLTSAVSNARHNDGLDPEELYVAACYADEGSTLKRWRPRARGRATRIRKRTCHITVIVARLPEERLERRRAKLATGAGASRARRVAASRRGTETPEATAESGNRATRRARARGELVDEEEETTAEVEDAEGSESEDEVEGEDEGAEGSESEDDVEGEVEDAEGSESGDGDVEAEAVVEESAEADSAEDEPGPTAQVEEDQTTQEVAGGAGSGEADASTEEKD